MLKVPALFLLFVLVGGVAHAELRAWDEAAPPAESVIVDARPLSACARQTLAAARCLPAEDFLDARGQLAPWREILWLFSTARLTGEETVTVIGDTERERHLVAGLLELAGQRRVYVATRPVRALLAAGGPAGPGMVRDFARQVVYTARLRETFIVLPRERQDGTRPLVADADPARALEQWVAALLRGGTPRILLGGES
jgi:hypothetical protein